MSQPVLMAALTLVAAVVVTAAIAVATFAKANTRRAIRVAIVGVAVALMALAIQHARLRINFTASMPIGIYSLSPLPAAGVERGMVVVACAPGAAAAVGQARGYLGAGPCPDGTEPLLKSAAAIAGDELDVTAAGVAVNGCRLPRSTPLARDRSGRRLVPWPQGHYRLGPGQVWLYADNARSWDSRYWGPGAARDVTGRAVPILVAYIAPPRECANPAALVDRVKRESNVSSSNRCGEGFIADHARC